MINSDIQGSTACWNTKTKQWLQYLTERLFWSDCLFKYFNSYFIGTNGLTIADYKYFTVFNALLTIKGLWGSVLISAVLIRNWVTWRPTNLLKSTLTVCVDQGIKLVLTFCSMLLFQKFTSFSTRILQQQAIKIMLSLTWHAAREVHRCSTSRSTILSCPISQDL